MVAIFVPRRLAIAWKLAANCGCRLAVCAVSHSTQRSHTEPCLEMWPQWATRSLPRTVGVSPAQDANFRADMPPGALFMLGMTRVALVTVVGAAGSVVVA